MTRAMRAASRRGLLSHYRLMTMYVCHGTLQASLLIVCHRADLYIYKFNIEVRQEALVPLMCEVKNV